MKILIGKAIVYNDWTIKLMRILITTLMYFQLIETDTNHDAFKKSGQNCIFRFHNNFTCDLCVVPNLSTICFAFLK